MKAHLEQILGAEHQSFISRRFVQERFDHPFHQHPELELTFIVKGSGTRIVGDHVGSFGPGDLCMLGPNLAHVYRNATSGVSGAEAEVLQFSRDCANGFFESIPELDGFSDLMERARLGLRFDSATAMAAGSQLKSIRESEGLRRWILFLELIELLVAAPRPKELASPGYAGAVGLASSEKMNRICQFILEHFDEDLSHEILANKLHISPAYFSRLFKKTTRKTYTQFLTEVRLGHACRLLSETDMAIVDISLSSGFQNLSNFNRRFQQVYGCSPREYRKMHEA